MYCGVYVCVPLQLCWTLFNPIGCSLPGSCVHGILQARILEWAAMPASRGSSQPRDRTIISGSSCISGVFFTTESLGRPCGVYNICRIKVHDNNSRKNRTQKVETFCSEVHMECGTILVEGGLN